MSDNKPTEVSGYVTRDAEAKVSKTGKPYILFSIAVVDKATDTTRYVKILNFDLAANAADFTKGATVRVTGKLNHDSWTGRDGVERTGWSCLASKVSVTEKPKARAVWE